MTHPGNIPVDTPEEVLRVQGLVETLFVAMRTIQAYGTEHPLSRQSTLALGQRILEMPPPFSLQFVGQALFRDRTMIPLPLRVYRLGHHLGQVLHRLHLQELVIDRTIPAGNLVEFCRALSEADAGRLDALDGLEVPGLSWRELPSARYGIEVEEVDPEVFSSAQLALAIGDAELLPTGAAPWSFAKGLTVVRRLERAVQVSREAVGRALELVPGPWSVARRAVAACTHVLTALTSLEASGATRRVAGHAALAISWYGLSSRGGGPFQRAAGYAVERLLEAPAVARTGVEPHRAKTSALLFLAAEERLEGDRPPPLLDLLRLAYEVEVRRCPGDVRFDLTLADLLATVLNEPIEGCNLAWSRVLATAYGEIPPGARVLLPDGRIGLVLGDSEAGRLRPQVLVNGAVVVPEGPVKFISPAALARAGGG